MKTLDAKLAEIHADPHGSRAFILADAKDADMAFGLAAPGVDARTGRPRSLADYRDQIREVIRQGLVDIVLMSCSTSHELTLRERLFDGSTVTPAIRANDTSDVHLPAGGTYHLTPSRPFRTALLDHAQAGMVHPPDTARARGVDLGLYSITPNNDIQFDLPTLEAYRDFRVEAEAKRFRHFLEVFDPNACGDRCPADVGRFINDLIVRTLAGVPAPARPLFLKMVYHGAAAMEALASYDPHLVPGVLGGSSGTTLDAFALVEEARRHGARAALFGRKINHSEHQLTFIRYLRAIGDGQIAAEEAVRAYHGDLQKQGIAPLRGLADDLQRTQTAASYGGAPARAGAATDAPTPARAPDFAAMTQAQKLAWSRRRIAGELRPGKKS